MRAVREKHRKGERIAARDRADVRGVGNGFKMKPLPL